MIDNSTAFVEEFKQKYEIDDDIPTDLTALFGKLDVSVLPNVFYADADSYILCEFSTDDNGRKTIHYRKEFLAMQGFPEGVVAVLSLGHYIGSGKTDFFLTHKTKFSEQEKMFAYEILMPRQLVEEILDKIEFPTISILSKIFHVPCEFVKSRLDVLEITKQIAGYNI